MDRDKMKTVHWLRPKIACEVAFNERTNQGHLRHLGQARWDELLGALGFERHRLTPAILKAWLIEQGWPAAAANERADELAIALADD